LVILILESEVKMTDLGVRELVDAVIAREGGFVDHPADRGGATNWGITEAVARQNGYSGPMRKLPRDLAASIYMQQYWQTPGFDRIAELAPKLAAELFDTGINMGTLTATSYLQRALNALNRNSADYADIIVDRQIGPATLNALRQFLAIRGRDAASVLIKAIDALQGAHYLRLAESRPSQEAFLYGWLANRIG
jgi:lysozyme family protein